MSKPSVDSLFNGNGRASATPPRALNELAEDVLAARIEADNRKLKYDEARKRADELEAALVAQLDAMGLKSIKTNTGATLTSAERRVYALPKTDDERERVYTWLRRVGAGALVKEQVNHQTLNAFCRERQEGGKPINELLAETTLRYLSVRKT